MNWIEIKIKTKIEAVEAVSNIFYEAGTKGVVIEDPKDYFQPSEDRWDYIEIPEQVDIEEVIVTGYLVEDSSVADRIQHIKSRLYNLPNYGLDTGKSEVQTNIISDTNWGEAWKKYYKPTPIGENIIICPSWETLDEKDAKKTVITIDPGMAFGTGTHETTTSCLELLEKYIKKGFTVIDMGCGSGILSIAAAKLGASKVLAIDKDEVACRVAKENIELNNLKSNIQVVKADNLENIDFKADLIVANIIADTIIDLCPRIPLYLKSKGVFIASGIIREHKFSVINALKSNGLSLKKQVEQNEWVSLVSSLASIKNQ